MIEDEELEETFKLHRKVDKGNFKLGDFVYLKTDEDQKKRMIISINFHINNSVTYRLSCGAYDSVHYQNEITKIKDI